MPSREDLIEALRQKRQEAFRRALTKERVQILPQEVSDADHKKLYREACGNELEKILARAAADRVRAGKHADFDEDVE